MSFQWQLLLTYSLLIIILVIALGTSFFLYTSNVFESNAYSNLEVITDKMLEQFDKHIIPMDLVTTYLLSDKDIISSISSLATIERINIESNRFITEAQKTIHSVLLSYGIDKNFYRVSFINRNGDFLTSNFRILSIRKDLETAIGELEWLELADSLKGRKTIIPPYLDPWPTSDNIKVFGLVRAVIGINGSMGYIEVQSPYSELEKIFSLPKEEGINVVVVTDRGEILYHNGIKQLDMLEYYSQLDISDDNKPTVIKNPKTGVDEIIVGAASDYTGIKVILIQDKSILIKPLLFTGNIAIMVGVLVIIISVICIYFLSKRLTKPIKELKEKMEATELDNLPQEIKFSSSNKEIESITRSFQRLRARLNESIQNEIKSRELQMQASFDSLQAQVNPHFIYNTLNVLANKGIETGDDEICEICDSIAAMLRYSTSTLKRYATIKDELEHVSNYLLLMKKRFEHRLVFNIDVDNEILDQVLPKIVLQHIVENSINHGFEKKQERMNIEIIGYRKGDCWHIEINDNGDGFDDKVLTEIKEKLNEMKSELEILDYKSGFQIGGMGLINTYARLMLFFKGTVTFEIKNNVQGGASVIIEAPMRIQEEEALNNDTNYYN